MGLVRYLQHWLSGIGPALQVTDFVPQSDPIRQWADTFPWDALVHAMEQRFAKRFPKTSTRGRRPVPIRVLLALEVLKHELGAKTRIGTGRRPRVDVFGKRLAKLCSMALTRASHGKVSAHCRMGSL